jgi:hypothetical protein
VPVACEVLRFQGISATSFCETQPCFYAVDQPVSVLDSVHLSQLFTKVIFVYRRITYVTIDMANMYGHEMSSRRSLHLGVPIAAVVLPFERFLLTIATVLRDNVAFQ